MGLAKIRALLSGQAGIKVQGNALPATAGKETGERIQQKNKTPDYQGSVQGWIAAAGDSRSSMTGGLLGSGELLR